MFLEVNYTFRHEDEDFMHKIQATELPDLIGPGLISLSYNLSPPEDVSEDEQDPTNLQQGNEGGSKEGVMAFNKSLAPDPVSALTKEDISPQGLRALNLTLYTLTVADLKKVLEVQRHIMVINVTLEVEPGEAWKKQLIEALECAKGLEQVEVVANPTLQFFMEVRLSVFFMLAKIHFSLARVSSSFFASHAHIPEFMRIKSYMTASILTSHSSRSKIPATASWARPSPPHPISKPCRRHARSSPPSKRTFCAPPASGRSSGRRKDRAGKVA